MFALASPRLAQLTAGSIAALLLAVAPATQALTLTVNDAAPTNITVPLRFTGSSGTYYNYSAGNLGANDGTNSFTVYCIDPLTTANTPSNYAATTLGTYLTGGSYTSQFAQTPYTNVQGTGYNDQSATLITNRLTDLYKYAYADSLTSAAKGAAFQWAIWEAIGESNTGLGRTVGGMQTSSSNSSFNTAADLYVQGMLSGNWGTLTAASSSYVFTVYVPTPQAGSQAFIRASLAGQNQGIPEPATAALALLGVVAAARVSRRRKAS